ncbi:KEOPS complex subunit Pcc1 [Thermococcus sp.]
MRVEVAGKIVWHYGDEERARAVAEAVEVDNLAMPPGLKKSLNLETAWVDGKVITKVKYSGEIETLIRALDDLVFSIKIAEGVTGKV